MLEIPIVIIMTKKCISCALPDLAFSSRAHIFN